MVSVPSNLSEQSGKSTILSSPLATHHILISRWKKMGSIHLEVKERVWVLCVNRLTLAAFIH